MIIPGFKDRVFSFLAVALVASMPSLPLLAQEKPKEAVSGPSKGPDAETINRVLALAPVTIGANASVTLPAKWKVSEVCQDDTPPKKPSSSLDVIATTLLVAAHPIDTTRRVGISLFRANFQGMGPPPQMPGIGAQTEAERLLCLVLGLGFSPTATQTSLSTSSQNTPLLIVEISARNAAGEERVFTDTVVGTGFPIVRLMASRSADDQVAAGEIGSIVKSLSVVANEQPNGTPRTFFSGRTNPNFGVPSQSRGPMPMPPANSSQTEQVVANYHDALLMVEGPKGAGSGFVCQLGSKTVAITNAHVLSGNPGFKITDLKSTVLQVSSGAVAVGHDIVKLEVTGTGQSFQVMENLDATVKIGDPVMVLGNAEGARVVKPVEGKVVGIGPNLVEVDAEFVPGNSGSPIVHQATGKVLGVATYLLERKASGGANQEVTIETRRFGYRLDSVKTWEPINWQFFYAQAAQVKNIDALSDDFIQLYKDCHKNERLDAGNYTSAAIQRAVQTFSASAQHKHSSLADRKDMLVRFFADLRNASQNDLLGFDSRNAYDYFRREVEEQTRFRDSIYEDLTRAMERRSN